MSTMQKPVVRLVGEDGNAFAIMGRWSAAARAEGWSSEEIRAVLDEAMAGDYDHLLLTIRANSDQTGVEWDEPEDVTREREASAEALADEYASHDEPPYGAFPEERMTTWAAESAAVARELRAPKCGVCHAPVLPDHDPSPIEWRGAGEDAEGKPLEVRVPGFIHGAFDCTDQPRCEGTVHVSGGGGMATTARCILPANHADAVGHLAGEPS